MKINDEITVPPGYNRASGYTARVLLCVGKGITVFLTNANRLTMSERYLWIARKDLRNEYTYTTG